MTTLSSPSLAMSPPIESANSESSFTACLTSSMLFAARGAILNIMMVPDFTSFLTVSNPDRSRRGIALR